MFWKILIGILLLCTVLSERVAVASLVYGAMMGRKDEWDCFCDHYRVTIEVERLDI